MRAFLRSLPVFEVDLPAPGRLSDDPEKQFLAWLDDAVAAGEPEPQSLGRQVRVRGVVTQGTREQARWDWSARGPGDEVPAEWSVWCLRASHVELWQASSDRQHHRARYVRSDSGWSFADRPLSS
ncbi:MAG: pyridoxamine 5-phosphate oxidase [Frankiales bacterium]|nr:pyridoxamine 5-phosphate oxidase [Frankiales bacterium]